MRTRTFSMTVSTPHNICGTVIHLCRCIHRYWRLTGRTSNAFTHHWRVESPDIASDNWWLWNGPWRCLWVASNRSWWVFHLCEQAVCSGRCWLFMLSWDASLCYIRHITRLCWSISPVFLNDASFEGVYMTCENDLLILTHQSTSICWISTQNRYDTNISRLRE